MLKYILATLLLFVTNSDAAPNKALREVKVLPGVYAPTNYVTNPSAFKNTETVTTSSAVVARDTDAADSLDGIASFTCDSSAQNGYCSWQTDGPAEGDKTGNCEFKGQFKGDGSLYKARVIHGSDTIADSLVLGNSTDWNTFSVNAPCAGSVTVRIVQTEAGTAPAINVGRMYWGKATNIGNIQQYGNWTSYTPSTTQGFGTPTGTSYYRTTPQGVQIRFAGTVGTVAASQGRWGLPTGCTTASTYFANGSWVGSGGVETTSINVTVLAAPSVTYINFGGVYAGVAGGVIQNGSAIATNNDDFSFFADVQCAGYSSNTVYRPEINASYYSGYHDNTCSWSRTNTAFGDFTADASCALVTRISSGISAAATGSVLPAIVLTLPKIGQYYVCADQSGYLGVGGNGSIRLWDGTNSLGDVELNTGNREGRPLCGILNATSLSATVTLQAKSPATSVNMNVVSSEGVINWTVFPITGNMPAPVLIGSITSGSTNALRLESWNVSNSSTTTAACTANPCTVNRSTLSGVTSGRTSQGIYTVAIPSGSYSSSPVCTCGGSDTGTAAVRVCHANASSTTNVDVRVTNSANSADDTAFNMVCVGPR